MTFDLLSFILGLLSGIIIYGIFAGITRFIQIVLVAQARKRTEGGYEGLSEEAIQKIKEQYDLTGPPGPEGPTK